MPTTNDDLCFLSIATCPCPISPRASARACGLRLALCPDLHFVELDAAVVHAIDEATKVFERLGAKLETGSFSLAHEVPPTREALSRGEFLALHRERFAARVNGQDVTFGSGLAMRQIFNVAGPPSVAVPIGSGQAGLPISMQIVGPAWGEAHVLRIAHAHEVATPELRRDRPTAIR